MEYIDNLTINCPACGSSFHEEGTVLGDGLLYTCKNCGQQSTVSDEMLLEAKQSSCTSLIGRPLFSRGTAQKSLKTGVESPLIANARRRAGETKTAKNPLIANAKKRVATAHTEVQKNV